MRETGRVEGGISKETSEQANERVSKDDEMRKKMKQEDATRLKQL